MATGLLALLCVADGLSSPRWGRRRAATVRSAATEVEYDAAPSRSAATEEYDAVIIGGGIGGLCSAALLGKYGLRVALVESHAHLGGCAHAFDLEGYTHDSGPSLWAGCSVASTNPLRQVLDAAGVKVDWVTYDGWGCHDLAAQRRWRFSVGPKAFDAVVADQSANAGLADGETGLSDWKELLRKSEPVLAAAMACPPMALRADAAGFVRTAFLPYLLGAVVSASLKLRASAPDFLTGSAAKLLALVPTKEAGRARWIDKWVDYLSFAISGLDSAGTVGAAVAYTLGDLHRPGAFLDYPLGGSGAVCEALARSVSDRPGCVVRTKAHVEEIIVEDGVATGVRMRNGAVLRANRAVISNADIWTTVNKLLPAGAVAGAGDWAREKNATVTTPSFVHLWVGFDAEGIPEDLDCHHSVFNEGLCAAPIDARENMYIISIPTVFDSTLAPKGKHLAHVYAAATEPYEAWEGLSREEYAAKKALAAEPLWRALEAVVPDVRSRADHVVVGTPLTHARFNRRHRGTYGPAGAAANGDLKGFSNGKTPIKNLFTVGDSNFPGIGVPAAAASACLVANSLVSVRDHKRLLAEMESAGTLCAGTDWWAAKPSNFVAGGRIAVDAPLDALGCAP